MMIRTRPALLKSRFACLVAALSALAAVAAGQPLSPQDSISRMELKPGFRIELFAAEPDVVDPVAMAFDGAGRLYVCEMREMEALPALTPGTKGTIRLLDDRDGDGRVDHATIFADGLSFPSGVAPFDGGVYALCTPDLLYLKDTDGDGVADVKRVVLSGFAEGNAEHRFNNLTWHFDGHIYAANGHGGGVVYAPNRAGAPKVDLGNRDFRFDPWGDRPDAPPDFYESVSRQTGGGFGLSFDDWGRRYVTNNEVHCTNVVLPQNYLSRNPYQAVRATSEDISAEPGPSDKVYPISRPQGWRIERTQRRAEKEKDKFRPDQLQVNGYYTAACGVTVYRDSLFPPEFRGNVFVCDAAQNLVSRMTLEERGTSMLATRAEENTEFLRSSDQWFRPVNLSVGPEGALYVVDFYREIIETGASIPPDIQAKLDLRAGSTMGRIYRILPVDAPSTFPPFPAREDSQHWLTGLASAGAWRRNTCQRLLLERFKSRASNSPEAAGVKQTLVKWAAAPSTSPTAVMVGPLAQLHALWALAEFAWLDEATLLSALKSPDPHLREQAIRLSEFLLARPTGSTSPAK